MGLCCCSTYIYYGMAAVALYAAYVYIKKYIEQKKWDRWSNTPEDVVILHGFPKSKTLPNASPFILKLQTYLRMAQIRHELDFKDMFGPKGQAPWITLNGQHIGDSQLIIEFLGKVIGLERFVFRGYNLHKIASGNSIYLWIVRLVLSYKVKTATWYQGISRHTNEEIASLMQTDLRAVSKILGTKKFILGDEPCEDDCAIFGCLAQAVWCLPDSPYEKLINEELVNIKEYCYRMKEMFFPDWEQCLDK